MAAAKPQKAFVRVETGCCRSNSADLMNDASLFVKAKGVKGNKKCAAKCLEASWCKAYEVGQSGCELHKIKADFGSGGRGCKCFNRVFAPGSAGAMPEIAAQPDDDETMTLLGAGCCRVGESGFPRWLTWLPDLTLDQCKDSCEQTTMCGGLEYKRQESGNSVCKLTVPYDSGAVRANNNKSCICYSKN